MDDRRHPGSFRDPKGFVFRRGGVLYRQIDSGLDDLERLVSTGLYDELVSNEILVPHELVDVEWAAEPGASAVIRPKEIEFVSYPYEWCFGQLQDAALLTLDLQRRAVGRGLSLKDASAYNVQFQSGRPIFIDTLSFEPYEEGRPWGAYRQFCEHFLGPLALMARKDIRLGALMRAYKDGIPLDLVASLLPGRTRLDFGLQVHLHAHARMQQKHSVAAGSEGASGADRARPRSMSRRAHLDFVDNLARTVERLRYRPSGTEWGGYDEGSSYAPTSLHQKREVVREFIERVAPTRVWDLGANRGDFSRLAVEQGAHTVAWDIDPAAVEQNYRTVREEAPISLLPLRLDLLNPSPGLGWENRETESLGERGPVDLILALALIHHLAISNNVPLRRIAAFLAQVAEHAIVEFIPKDDPRVRQLLSSRDDHFSDYTRDGFEAAFGSRFELCSRVDLRDSARILYLWRRL